jgi:heme/copper-type cytochrome/quinol oxidase subunit 3
MERAERQPRVRLAENGVFGMALFVLTEVMLFSGFISAFTIFRGTKTAVLWPPPDQPRLPVATTGFNTALLLLSGVLLFVAHRRFRSAGHGAATPWMGAAILFGAGFVGLQGVEWVRLLARGFTMHSSELGAFFYLIVGAHALHAVVALVALLVYWQAMRAERLSASQFGAIQLFWYFVVLLWPLIYWRVYL